MAYKAFEVAVTESNLIKFYYMFTNFYTHLPPPQCIVDRILTCSAEMYTWVQSSVYN